MMDGIKGMARTTNRLTDLRVRREKAPGLYHDGRGLYLQVIATGAKSWVFRYMLRGRAREMGLGSYPDVALADARTKAKEARNLRADGIDPIEARRAKKAVQALAEAKSLTFDECCDGYAGDDQTGWGIHHKQGRTNSIRGFVTPVLGKLSAAKADTPVRLNELEPILTNKHEKA